MNLLDLLPRSDNGSPNGLSWYPPREGPGYIFLFRVGCIQARLRYRPGWKRPLRFSVCNINNPPPGLRELWDGMTPWQRSVWWRTGKKPTI